MYCLVLTFNNVNSHNSGYHTSKRLSRQSFQGGNVTPLRGSMKSPLRASMKDSFWLNDGWLFTMSTCALQTNGVEDTIQQAYRLNRLATCTIYAWQYNIY